MTECALCRATDSLRTGDDSWTVCQPCLCELVTEGYRRHDEPVRVIGLVITEEDEAVCRHGTPLSAPWCPGCSAELERRTRP